MSKRKIGICILSIVPVRAANCDKSEMITQLLYGDLIEIVEIKDSWVNIKTIYDGYYGFIDIKQYKEIKDESLVNFDSSIYATDLVQFIKTDKHHLQSILIGSDLTNINILNHEYEGNISNSVNNKNSIVNTALLYLDSPYLWGGKTPFGIDCSGFTQMVYKINGHKLLRDAKDQAKQGETLSFIDECEPGDLAFFHNSTDEIVHVGIILKDNYIIHASGKVKIDRLDQTGIYDNERNIHTHNLRFIKKIF